MIAELTDNVGWELLIGLAQEMGQTDMVQRFNTALGHEERHLRHIKQWHEKLVLKEQAA